MKKTNQNNSQQFALAALLIGFAALSRLLPHPMNFTPMLAIAIFGGATLPRRLALAIPLAAMFLSDVALGYGFGPMNLVIYSCIAAGTLLGWSLRQKRTTALTLGAALGGSMLFFVVTNFVVWLGPMMAPPFDYPHTLAGLGKCYWMALPFFRNSLAGDLAWTTGIFAVYDAARAWGASRGANVREQLSL
ncbi:hypothetical protein B1R32_106134 [Abditibacterium utsteinense]|uniref:ECF transporter S component n=1 Tax=Abditibacterium utsteinense TaxID=1960156 RepID=A0A2S8SU33_9BACT|nr:DUF6580 family putative transport protein [Abditibacterium utsteinense]PQV64288.1 hypothetical protein B1R32_106134 [Abditibacterium utsteinense]